MKVGFCAPYRKCEATLAILPVLQHAQLCGFGVEVLATESPASLSLPWDDYVVKPSKNKYWAWIKNNLSHLVFTQPVEPNWLEAARQQNITTTLILLWDEITEEAMEHLHLYDNVVCPAKCVWNVVREHSSSLNNLKVILWDSGQPLTQEDRPVDGSQIAVIWIVDTPQMDRQDEATFRAIESTLSAARNTWVTVVHASTLTGPLMRAIRVLSEASEGRVETFKNVSLEEQHLLLASHDLMLWPSVCESVGLSGLLSLTMGTPVVAYDHPLIGEVVKHNVNGVLASCELDYNWLGAPSVIDSHESYAKQLQTTLHHPGLLENLRLQTQHRLLDRRQGFRDAWNEIWGVTS